MSAVDVLSVGLASVCLVAACALGWRRPVPALVVLLALLPVHSLAIVVAREWVGSPPALNILGLWKEALIGGLVLPIVPGLLHSAVAGATVVRRTEIPRPTIGTRILEIWRDRDFDASVWLVVALLGYLALEVPVSIARGNPTMGVVLDWRGLSIPFLAFLAIRLRRLTTARALPAIRAVVLMGGVVAIYSFVQVFVLGFRFLNTFYRDPGEPLATAYRVGVSAVKVPRAIGGHVAPNEFGLFLVVVTFGYLVILLRRPASPPIRRVQLLAGYLMLVAVMITYSRSAWLGAIAAAAVVVMAWVRPSTLQGIRRRSKQVLIGTVATIGVFVVIAVASGALTVAQATVGGTEASASGRATSISRGVGAAIKNPLGVGLGAAGPRAYAIDKAAVRTESWYLVTAVELGWLGGGLFLLTLGSMTRDLIRGWRRQADGALPAIAAWTAALLGALVIPALFDLPAAVPLFVLVGLAASSIVADEHEAARVGTCTSAD